ncbi:MAG: hypothetical protein J6I49_03265 [Bacteroidales bacterium]|nr:hypothetical protein [Bacteroidales bacterium]
MAKQNTTGLLLNGRLKTSGITFYQRSGATVVRAATSAQPRRNSRAQFETRQRMRHTTALWQSLRHCQPMFTGGKSAYARFASLANRLPAVYLPGRERVRASVLMPDIPVSDGTLMPVKQRLGEVDGTPALLTDLDPATLIPHERIRLYTLEQHFEGPLRVPQARFSMEEVKPGDLPVVDGTLAWVDSRFAATDAGWALVRVNVDRCSSQSILTRSTLHLQYTTEEALLRAAEDYGGLTS